MSDRNPYALWLLIEGNPFLERVFKFREEDRAVAEAWKAYGLSKGAEKYRPGSHGLIFGDPKTVPKDWKKPNSRGWSQPKNSNTKDISDLASLPKPPSKYDVFGPGFLYSVNYEGPGRSGSSSVGGFYEGPIIGWAGDIFFACLPNARKASEDHVKAHPEDKIINGALEWVLPEGLREISEARVDLIVAQYKVQKEEAQANKETTS